MMICYRLTIACVGCCGRFVTEDLGHEFLKHGSHGPVSQSRRTFGATALALSITSVYLFSTRTLSFDSIPIPAPASSKYVASSRVPSPRLRLHPAGGGVFASVAVGGGGHLIARRKKHASLLLKKGRSGLASLKKENVKWRAVRSGADAQSSKTNPDNLPHFAS